MPSKMQNKISKFLYRPTKKSENLDFLLKKIDEVENSLSKSIGGIFASKKPKKSDKKAWQKLKNDL